MKVVSGANEGTTGMVVKVEGHVLIILSDITKEQVSQSTCFSEEIVLVTMMHK